MLIVMTSTATPDLVARVCEEIEKMGLVAHPMFGAQRTAIGVTGNKRQVDSDRIANLPGVQEVIHVTRPYQLASREYHPEDTVVDIGGVKVGGEEFTLMAGPCSVESEEQCLKIAEVVAEAGVRIFRGGAYKPRSSPHTFQGLGEKGLEILAGVRERFGLKIVTEAMDTDTLELVARYTDIIQIGARNMQNYSLLRKAGQTGKPILLKRGQAATLEELLLSAEYILAENNPNVILCERGVRTLANHSRNTLDLSAIPFIKSNSHLPIIADPSHGTGRREKVLPLSRAAMAVGADGLMVEVHHRPEAALSDGAQSITPDMFRDLMNQLRRLAPALDKVSR
ncbi:MAG: 3-deoxy-7-phosphoheptulonate synthase [candidate division Zixibacteria bacterium]|nr:3-deoxy-7-phosphoheptulonate synthase [candidate division Zixibacteria bacterium]